MRSPQEYIDTAKRKFGSSFDPEISGRFANQHQYLLQDDVLKSYLYSTRTSIPGEMFWIDAGKPNPRDRTIKFVGTSYSYDMIGIRGTFVVHSQLIDHVVPFDLFGNDGRFGINWDTDLITENITIDSAFVLLDRTSEIFDVLFSRYGSKWSSTETEGYVIHPENIEAPRLKIIDPFWKQRRNQL